MGGAANARVLYLGGCQRSGTTLLDRMLGQVPGVVSTGEVVHLWRRGVLEDQLCGCGERFHACPFWTRVGAEAFGGWSAPEVEEAVALQPLVDRTRFVPLMVAPVAPRAYTRRLRRYAWLLARLYAGIAAAAGGAVVVDSSKHASTAYLLRRVPGVDVRLVHVVRDGRGVAHSLAKRVRRPEVVEGEAFMPTAGPVETGLGWAAVNALFEALPLVGVPRTLVRYESLVADPRAELGRVLAALGTTEASLAFVDDRRVRLGRDHTVAGNPMRFATGEVELRLDDAWQTQMPMSQRRAVTTLTAPLLVRYGYALGRRA